MLKNALKEGGRIRLAARLFDQYNVLHRVVNDMLAHAAIWIRMRQYEYEEDANCNVCWNECVGIMMFQCST